MFFSLISLVALSAPALADQVVTGTNIRIYFDSTGTWNDQDAGAGFQALHNGEWLDWAYAGYPWQMLSYEYKLGDQNYAYYANSNAAAATCTVTGESNLSTASDAIASYTYDGTGSQIVQTESWALDARDLRVNLHVTNTDANHLVNLGVYFEVDPDPDGPANVYTTINDTLDTDGDGLDDLVVSSSATTGYALAFGACDPTIAELGHNASWSTSYSDRPTLTDEEAGTADDAMGIRYAPTTPLAPGESGDLTFVVLEGDSVADVEAAWASTDLCGGCDADGDGHNAEFCGGDDCDDTNPAAYPGAPEVWYDGVDEDCAGGDDYDQDADGYDSAADTPDGAGSGLPGDCDDTNPTAYPGATDTWYDGVDSDCAGNDDYDADGDGYESDDFGGDDCNDNNAAINPGATEIWYDGVDQNCDGNDTDQDGDGYPSPEDCDDTNPDIYPGAPGVNGDGVDSDCDGSDNDVAAAGDTAVVKVGGGCGCASAPDAGVGWLILGLVGVAVGRRRRRPARRG